MGRFIDITGAPIQSDFQEMPLDFMAKALESKQLAYDKDMLAADEYSKLIPKGYEATSKLYEPLTKQVLPELENLTKRALLEPEKVGRELVKWKTNLEKNPAYQALKADEENKKLVLENWRKAKEKGEALPLWRLEKTPLSYEKVMSGEETFSPEYYDIQQFEDPGKYVDDQLDDIKSVVSSYSGESIRDLVQGEDGGLYGITSSGKRTSNLLNDRTLVAGTGKTIGQLVQDRLNSVTTNLLTDQNTAANYFRKAVQYGYMDNFGANKLSEAADRFVKNRFKRFEDIQTENKTGYNQRISGKELAELNSKEYVSNATPGQYLGEKGSTEFNLRQEYKTLDGNRNKFVADAIAAKNRIAPNISAIMDPNKTAKANAAEMRKLAEQTPNKAIRDAQLKAINDYESAMDNFSIADKQRTQVLNKFESINNTIADKARYLILNDKDLSKEQKEKELKFIDENKNKIKGFLESGDSGNLYYADFGRDDKNLSNFDLFKLGNKYWSKALDNYKVDYYTGEQNPVIQTVTLNIAPKSKEKIAFDVIKNRVNTGELKVEGKNQVSQRIDERLKDQGFDVKSYNISDDVIKYDNNGNAYLTIEVTDTDDKKHIVEQKVVLDDNFIDSTNNMFTSMATSKNKTVQDQGKIGLVNNYLYSTGQKDELNKVDLYGKASLNIEGTPMTVEKVGNKYLVDVKGNKTYYNSLNDVKLNMAE